MPGNLPLPRSEVALSPLFFFCLKKSLLLSVIEARLLKRLWINFRRNLGTRNNRLDLGSDHRVLVCEIKIKI